MKEVLFLPESVTEGRLVLEGLPVGRETKYISITGQDGAGKTSLRDGLARYFAEQDFLVMTSKSPCDPHVVDLINNGLSQNGYKDEYSEQLAFSFTDGLLSNYMYQLDGRVDYFICQRGPIDQYAHGITRSGWDYSKIYQVQRPERLAKFDVYIHMNCDPEVAWERVKDDTHKDRYEYLEYFKPQSVNTQKLYDAIVSGHEPELEFLRVSKHYYIDTTYMTIEQVFDRALGYINQ